MSRSTTTPCFISCKQTFMYIILLMLFLAWKRHALSLLSHIVNKKLVYLLCHFVLYETSFL